MTWYNYGTQRMQEARVIHAINILWDSFCEQTTGLTELQAPTHHQSHVHTHRLNAAYIHTTHRHRTLAIIL